MCKAEGCVPGLTTRELVGRKSIFSYGSRYFEGMITQITIIREKIGTSQANASSVLGMLCLKVNEMIVSACVVDPVNGSLFVCL